jgi:hypothetical protein
MDFVGLQVQKIEVLRGSPRLYISEHLNKVYNISSSASIGESNRVDGMDKNILDHY